MASRNTIYLWALGTVSLAVVALSGDAEESDSVWTDSLQSKEGLYALRAEPATRLLLLMRADDRGETRQLRLRPMRGSSEGAPVSLRRAEGSGPPWRFASDPAGWDGRGDAAELEASDDGKRWVRVGVFRRHEE